MYPLLKLTSTLIKAKYAGKMNLEEKSVVQFRVGFTDIDPFMELNNARYFNYMELGRWDYSYRTGFLALMKKNNWGAAVGGASIRYRRRISLFKKFSLSTQLICHDGRWLYFLQETHLSEMICSSALMKVCVTSKNGLVPVNEVIDNSTDNKIPSDIPEWVSSWIEAEGQRPWPSK